MTDLIDITAPADQQEGTFAVLRSWLKQPGDSVAQDEPVAELETDKVAVEVSAPADGVLQELVRNIDDEIEPGAVIARLSPGDAVNGAKTPAETPAKANGAAGLAADAVPCAPFASEVETRHSPAVRRLIQEHGLEGATIPASGKNGRITKHNVLDYLAKAGAGPKPAPSAGTPEPSAVPSPLPDGDVHEVPHTSMRRQIAAHMHKSVSAAPHVTALFEMDLTAVTADRRRRKADFEARGVKLTFTAYFVRACVEALRAVPEVNSRFYDDRIDIYKRFNIGVGTALGDKGLVVPVIHDAQDLNLFGIASRLQDLTSRAKSGALTPKDVQGGTFSISNHGVSGSLLASPIIINQPQSAILGLGKMEKRVVVEETPSGDAMAIKSMAFVTLSIDHRVLDGHQTNKFLTVFTDCIANWSGE